MVSAEHPYIHSLACDTATGLWFYEYVSETAGSLRIGDLSDIEVFNLCDEMDAADAVGDDWEQVLVRWSLGYRNANP